MAILVIADLLQDPTAGAVLHPATLNTLGAAAQVGGDIHVLVAGVDVADAAQAAARFAGVSKVLVADDLACAYLLAENLTPLVMELASRYSHVLAPATANGKNLLPRVAALLDVDQISDIISIESENTFKRPIYAGNAIATVRSSSATHVITVRPTAFAAPAEQPGAAPVEALPAPGVSTQASVAAQDLVTSDRPELTSANVVVAGGRGLQSGENFHHLYSLADKLGGAVGASRAAVDAGYVSNDLQVGQTGKIVAPQLYIAVGISGAIQHLAGMKDSKVIVAINKDEEAPIFQVADYGLVADLFEAMPALLEHC